ncbi:murein biosynthesis integral membrane protein MurJ [Kordiimonas laminariae]|uniref:murein biosynthesis integral membrane protein MurJ n=1 Tax=Kordiimonas laminariae TaxID=2917717 RepID=UPI001FF3027E|nr:murein biosynthesis integral membrane protein MurJ [Kordiimonas laminariae]
MSLIKGISTVGGFTLLSRVFGFVRDMFMAKYLGAGLAADAFFIAFKLPNFFRRLFAEGAFSVGFVPLFSRRLGKHITPESRKTAEEFASHVLSWLFPILLFFLIVMEIGMVPIMFGLTGGFEGDTQKFNFVVELGRYIFPYLLLISLMSFFSGVLNAYGRYSAAAFAPVILNIFMIIALYIYGESELEAAKKLAITVSVAGFAQLLWVYGAALRAGIRIYLPRPRLSENVKELLSLIGPAAIGAGIIQINLLIDVVIAARFLPEGSVSWLFYADRLNQLPLGVIGIAVGTVLLPSISRLLAGGDEAGANRQQNRALEFSLFLTLPSAAALMVAAGPIIATLFERDAFNSADTAATALALTVYAAGLPAYVIAKALTPGYFARRDTKTPVKFAAISLMINTVLNIILIQFMGHVGLAAATAIAAWASVFMFYGGLKKRGQLTLERDTVNRLMKFSLSAFIMAGVLFYSLPYVAEYFITDGITRISTLVGVIIFGVILYFIPVFSMKALTITELKRFIRPNA